MMKLVLGIDITIQSACHINQLNYKKNISVLTYCKTGFIRIGVIFAIFTFLI